MDEQLRDFIYTKNGWSKPMTEEEKTLLRKSRNKNINGEKILRLVFDGKVIYRGPVNLCQYKKRCLCKTYGIGPERARERFKITY